MWRISNGQWKIVSITKGQQEIDGFVIIPGVTYYQSITIKGSSLVFGNEAWTESISVYFKTEGDLERFLTGFERDFKIDQVLNTKNNDGK